MTLRAVVRRSTRRAAPGLALAAVLAVAVTVLGACQAMFTYSPLSGLQRPPSSMTPAQRLTYAQDALASGNTGDMKAAYDAIRNDSGAQAQYLTAQLGIELSGVPDLLLQVASDTSTLTTQLNDTAGFISSHNLDPNYMVAAAGQFTAAAAAGASLTPVDYAMGSMGLLLGATSGTWNITTVPAGTGAAAQAYLAPALADVASLAADDPLRTFIQDYNTYLGTLP